MRFLIVSIVAMFMAATVVQAQEQLSVRAKNAVEFQRVPQKLVAPPFLPTHDQVAIGNPKIVEVRMGIEEKQIEVESGAFIWAFTVCI